MPFIFKFKVSYKTLYFLGNGQKSKGRVYGKIKQCFKEVLYENNYFITITYNNFGTSILKCTKQYSPLQVGTISNKQYKV